MSEVKEIFFFFLQFFSTKPQISNFVKIRLVTAELFVPLFVYDVKGTYFFSTVFFDETSNIKFRENPSSES